MSRHKTESEDVDLLDEDQDEPVVTDDDVDDFFEDDEKPTDRRRDPLRIT